MTARWVRRVPPAGTTLDISRITTVCIQNSGNEDVLLAKLPRCHVTDADDTARASGCAIAGWEVYDFDSLACFMKNDVTAEICRAALK